MMTCPSCQHTFHGDLHEPPKHCPECGAKLHRDSSTEWVPVARLNDMADSGYFSDILRQHEIEVRVHGADEFNALLGLWESAFVLQVRPGDAQQAAEVIREELESGGEEPRGDKSDTAIEPAHSESYFRVPSAEVESHDWLDERDDSQGAPLWKSVALVLVAGGLAYGVGQSTARRNVPEVPEEQRDALWQALSQPGETFVTEGPPGVRRYRLRYDLPSDQIHMDEDIDGDGRYDRRQIFERGRLVKSQ